MRVLIIEDNEKLARTIKASLEQLSYCVDLAYTATQGDEMAVVEHHDLARAGAREDVSRHVPVSIHDIVLDAVRRCRPLATMREVRVVPVLSEHGVAAVEVMGDPILLESMLVNLLRNALQSAPRGSPVHLQVRVHGDEVVLSVRDQGAQVDIDQMGAIFGSYFEVLEPARAAGSGLGLAIAKRVAEHHRGSISVRNRDRGGCEFEVQLPLWRPGTSTRAAAGQPPQE